MDPSGPHFGSKFTILLFLLVIPTVSLAGSSSQVANDNLLLFRAFTFDPLQSVPGEITFGLTEWREKQDGNVLHVLQFLETPTRSFTACLFRSRF